MPHGRRIDKRCIKKTLGETARPDGSYSHFALQNGGPELVVNPLEAVQLFLDLRKELNGQKRILLD